METIELREQNILVSAAAGSGKTAVLVERIKQLILHDKVSVDRILVVTFTKAAASEMKEKLIKSLNQAISENPNRSALLREQLEKIPRANISTFHSFALEVIRQYFHLIDLDPGFKVCDEAESQLMKADGMDQVFDDYFLDSSPAFLNYIQQYGSAKNEVELKKSLVDLYNRLRSIPNSFAWLQMAIEKLNLTTEEFQASDLMAFIKKYVSEKVEEAKICVIGAQNILEEQGLEKLGEKCKIDLEKINKIQNKMDEGDIESGGHFIATYKGEIIRASKEQEPIYNEIKDQVKELRDRAKNIFRKELAPKFFSFAIGEYIDDLNHTYSIGSVMAEILIHFHEVYGGIKQEKALLDFSDIEHYTIEILNNPLAAQEYREKFQYIFIDEYQDSNLLQEKIIEAIQRDNNVFMVGDIKQSIYKFRLAEPEIFLKKYNRFKKPETLLSTKIDLNQNFRSKSPIIHAVNGIFSQLMHYDEDAALHSGIPDMNYPENPVELYIADGTSFNCAPQELLDENIESLKLVELEGVAAAKIIREALGTPIYDVKIGKIRPLKKRDIVILMHGVKRRGEIFFQALQNAGVESYFDDHNGYFDTIEITLFSDLLRVIDNFKQDVPLLGVLRSPVFGYGIDELVEIRCVSLGLAFYHALKNYGSVGKNSKLIHKTQMTLEKLNRWKQESRYTPIDEFAWELMRETGYYAYVGALPGGSLRQANLRIFVERTKAFRESGDGSIYGLLRYMNALAEKEVETGQASIVGEDDDIVRIMTIHKSKGLEFPMVLVASLGTRFVFDKMDKNGVIHKDLGIGITRIDSVENWYRHTIMQNAIMAKKRKEELDEAVRVLYVSFTRAMDKLILLGSVTNWERDRLKYETGAKSESNYLGMIIPHISEANIHVCIQNRDQLMGHISQQNHQNSTIMDLVWDPNITNSIGERSADVREIIANRLSYAYPNEFALHTKSKYAVSEINGRYSEKIEIHSPSFISAAQSFSSAEIGTIIHKVMEHIDPKKFHDAQYLHDYMNELVNKELLLPEEAELVDISSIITLANSNLGRRMAAAKVIHRETPFNMLYPMKGEEVMVQGVIDCWFEEHGELILLDYKTGRVDGEQRERYRQQLMLYKKALELNLQRTVDETYLYLFSQGRLLEIK